jgi:transcriptional regulator with XRE-family HTH domain
MSPAELKEWRRKLGLTQEKAAQIFRVSRVAEQNWESGATPVPDWVDDRRVTYEAALRRRPEYGPVVLHYIQHLPMRPSPEAIAGMETEFDIARRAAFPNVGEALERVRFLASGLHSDFRVTDEVGTTIMDTAEVMEAARHFHTVGGLEEFLGVGMRGTRPNRGAPSQKPSPEEIERRMRLLTEIQDEVKKLPDLDPGFSDKDLYDEDGLPK